MQSFKNFRNSSSMKHLQKQLDFSEIIQILKYGDCHQTLLENSANLRKLIVFSYPLKKIEHLD